MQRNRPPEMTYAQAIRRLNEAAYDAIRTCADTVQYPDVDRQALREIARQTDRMVDEAPKEDKA